MQHGVGKGLHDVDMFVKSWIQLFCGQNALIVPLWCASEQRISNKTRMTATFTSYKVNVNLHSIRDLFKMTFKKRNQNKWLWQKLNTKNTKMIKTVSSLWEKGDRRYKCSNLMPTDHVCRQSTIYEASKNDSSNEQTKHFPNWNVWDRCISWNISDKISKQNETLIETCGTYTTHVIAAQLFGSRYPHVL